MNWVTKHYFLFYRIRSGAPPTWSKIYLFINTALDILNNFYIKENVKEKKCASGVDWKKYLGVGVCFIAAAHACLIKFKKLIFVCVLDIGFEAVIWRAYMKHGYASISTIHENWHLHIYANLFTSFSIIFVTDLSKKIKKFFVIFIINYNICHEIQLRDVSCH